MWLSVVMKSASLSCPCVQIKKMSSIKRHHTRGLYGAFSRAVASRDPINRFAYGGAILVPMAVPCFCRKNCPSNSKLLFCKMMLMRSHMVSVGGLCVVRLFSMYDVNDSEEEKNS